MTVAMMVVKRTVQVTVDSRDADYDDNLLYLMTVTAEVLSRTTQVMTVTEVLSMAGDCGSGDADKDNAGEGRQ